MYLHPFGKTSLFFSAKGLILLYANIRVSLRKMRKGQRTSDPLDGLEEFGMPALRLKEVIQEIFHLRCRRWQSFTLHWHWRRRTLLQWRRLRLSLISRFLLG